VFRGDALQAPQHVELENPYATANAEGIEILLNESGGRRMVFDEHDFSSTAAERFDADGASAGEEVEKRQPGMRSARTLKRDSRRRSLVGRRARPLRLLSWRLAKCSGDDAHGGF